MIGQVFMHDMKLCATAEAVPAASELDHKIFCVLFLQITAISHSIWNEENKVSSPRNTEATTIKKARQLK